MIVVGFSIQQDMSSHILVPTLYSKKKCKIVHMVPLDS